MMVIGIDARKRSHTAVRIDEKGSLLATKTKCDLAVRISVGADGSWRCRGLRDGCELSPKPTAGFMRMWTDYRARRRP